MANYDFTYTGSEIQAILDTGKKLKDSGYIFLGVATPSTNPGTPTQKVYYEAKQAGTYTNFGGVVLSEGLSLLIWDGAWTAQTLFVLDDEPTAGSNNLVKSGGIVKYYPVKLVKDNIDFAVSDYNGNAVIVVESGDVKTKNFNSSLAVQESKQAYKGDLVFADKQGNVLAVFCNGDIEVKNFNSSIFRTNILRGKKVAFLGDSITHGASANPISTNRYSAIFCDMLGCEEYNYGVNGASFAPISGTTNLIKAQVTQQNIEGKDLIFVWGGTNDFTYDIDPIGQPFTEVSQPESSTWAPNIKVPNQDTDCFCGGVVDVITSIRNINPNARLVFINILNRGNYYNGTGQERRPSSAESNRHNEYVQDYRKVVKELCEFYAIPVVDMNDLFNQDWQNDDYPTSQLSSMTVDGLHPNNAGHHRIAEILVKWVLSNLVI